jgi:hypothetical protein
MKGNLLSEIAEYLDVRKHACKSKNFITNKSTLVSIRQADEKRNLYRKINIS